MDKYLESLKPKTKDVPRVEEVAEIETETIPEGAPVFEPEEGKEFYVSTEKVDACVKEEDDDAADDVDDVAADDAEIMRQQSDPDPYDEDTLVATYEPKLISVSNIRVYSTPDTRGIARTVSGNIEILGYIEDFAIITYIRPGFGPVRGYTPKSNLN